MMKTPRSGNPTRLANAVQIELSTFHKHLSNQLLDASQQSEVAVLRIGKSLESILEESQEQSQDISGLTQSVTGGSQKQGIAQTLHVQSMNTSRYVSRMNQTLTQQANEVHQALQQAEGIRAAASRIKDISTASQLLSLNARIEATRLGSQAAGFITIANEMKELSRSVESANMAIAQLTDQLAQILPMLSARSVQMQQWSSQFASEFASQSQEVDQQTTELLGCVRRLDEEGRGRQQRLVQLTQRSLSDLQFHDPMAQAMGALDKSFGKLEQHAAQLMSGCACATPTEWVPLDVTPSQPALSPGEVKLF